MGSTIEDNKQLARRLGEAINARRWDLLDGLVAPDFVRHCEATPGVDVKSLDAFKEYLKYDATVFPDSVQTLKHMVAEGDLVALWLTYEGTQQAAMGPFPASGRRMQIECGVIVRVKNGRIAEMWVTWDNMAALAQHGHLTAGPGTAS